MKMEAYEKEHLKRVRKYLAECAVLLKSNGDFPLEAPGRIAAFGSGVRHTIKGGTGSGDVNSRFTVNVETGLEKSGFTLVTKGWLNRGLFDNRTGQALPALREFGKYRQDSK